jgi:hypothetical protein
MKFALGAAVAALTIMASASAFAQAPACPAAPAVAPTIPAIGAKSSELAKTDKAFGAWQSAIVASLDCERGKIDALKANPDVLAYNEAVAKVIATQDKPEVKDYLARVGAYNAQVAKVKPVQDQWKAVVEASKKKN